MMSKSELKRLCPQDPTGMATELQRANERLRAQEEEIEELRSQVAVLFDGYAVWKELTLMERARVTPSGISIVLDAVVRLIRKRQAAPKLD